MATFNNRASITYNGVTTNSNVVTGELLETLGITKTSISTTYTPNGTVKYAVTIKNTGANTINNLTLTDTLGAYTFSGNTVVPLTYVDGSATVLSNGAVETGVTVNSGPPLTISNISVPANSCVVVIYDTTTNEYASPTSGSTINNTATLTGEDILTPLSDSATTTASTDPQLAITKSLDPITVPEGGTVTYTFGLTNTGSTQIDPEGNVILSDTFNPILQNINVTYNSTTWTEGTDYTYNNQTGEFTTLGNNITLPAATYTQDATTGAWTVTPGSATIQITGTI